MSYEASFRLLIRLPFKECVDLVVDLLEQVLLLVKFGVYLGDQILEICLIISLNQSFGMLDLLLWRRVLDRLFDGLLRG